MKFLRIAWVILIAMLIASPGLAQDDPLDRDNWVPRTGDWSDDDNWQDDFNNASGVPTLDFERWARIGNGGTASLGDESSTGALEIANGTLDIGNGGALTVDSTSLTSGMTTVGRVGNLVLSGGSFSGKDLTSEGTINLGSSVGSFSLSGDFNNTGDLLLEIGSAGSPSIAAGGAVTLGGTIQPTFNGVTPGNGDNFRFVSGANSIVDRGLELILPETVVLDRGLSAALTTDGGNAAINITNVPVLSVDRVSGNASIQNVIGDALELTGYSIFSENGLLNVDSWNSLADQGISGWGEASPGSTVVAELGFNSASLVVGEAGLSIGGVYVGGATPPTDEDLRFEASLADGSVVAGIVEYTGAPNNLTLRVDPDTGAAEISHLSSFIDPVDLIGYTIESDNGSLTPDTWTAFGGDWAASPPNETNGFGEILGSGSDTFSNGTERALGNIFNTAGARDLTFQFATADNRVFNGTVVYEGLDVTGGGGGGNPLDNNGDGVVDAGDLEAACAVGNLQQVLGALGTVVGDFDGVGGVAFPDFLILSGNFGSDDIDSYTDGDTNCSLTVDFPDFLAMSQNFGQGGGTAAAVPEPNGATLLFAATLLLGVFRGRNR